jgi:acyl transferase domain-containing protein
MDADYWVRNLRETVWFAPAIASVAAAADTIFLEVSPHPIVVSAMQETLRQAGSGVALPSLLRHMPAREMLLRSAGRLYASGCRLRWAELNGPCTTFVRHPEYPWRRDRFWMDRPQPARAGDTPAVVPGGPLPTAQAAPRQASSGARQGNVHDRQGNVQDAVTRCIAQVLNIPARKISPSQALSSLGFDSVMAAEVQYELLSMGLAIPKDRFLGDGTIRDAATAAAPVAPRGR